MGLKHYKIEARQNIGGKAEWVPITSGHFNSRREAVEVFTNSAYGVQGLQPGFWRVRLAAQTTT